MVTARPPPIRATSNVDSPHRPPHVQQVMVTAPPTTLSPTPVVILTLQLRTRGRSFWIGFTANCHAFPSQQVAYLSLGLVSVMLAIIVCIVQPSLSIFYVGVHFWVGFPFIVSGILNLVAYKFPKACWMALAFISLVVNFGVSIGGLVITAGDIDRLRWYNEYDEDICTKLRNQRNYYGTAAPPRYYYNDYDHNLSRCKEGLQKYQYLLHGLTIMSLLLLIWGLCLAILSMGSRVKSFCCSCKGEITEEKADALITSNLSGDVIIA
ncbi:hypothetical protein GDO78_000714 [Eleutherodactylus coqui]|uniref:Uncharacterized protein n=1 Tax=Eleutherodactylus coqui TaxID=57060 RepID=A0A8J6FQ03_ELECQ|nr:hypothetical protein GDO78_000714 [Eleutherodactylus coqui]KAG9492354.1 hypothetical protein GDO78_000714 [Eleutherodactylus coqui]